MSISRPVASIDLRGRRDTTNLPANLEAEQALLGIMMYDDTASERLAGHQIASKHFFEPFHQRLFEIIGDAIQSKRTPSAVLMAERIKSHPAFPEFGGLGYLTDMVDMAPPSSTVASYADAICSGALRRNLIEQSRQTMAMASDPDVDPVELATASEKNIGDLARGADPGEGNLVDARSAAEETLFELRGEVASGKPKGLMTGLRCFDRRLRGLRPGHLIVVAGRPSMGKSGLARQAAIGAAGRNPDYQFPFFCLEMARREITERTLSEMSYRDGQGIPYQDLGEKLTPMELDRLDEMTWKIPRNFILDDTPNLSVEYVRRRCWALKRKGPIGGVFIDYLQIMERPDAKGRNEASVIGSMTSALKRLGREMGCAVVLLSQVTRGVEGRDDKRPQLSDLRESGSIEQDANSVLFPFREVYYLQRSEPKAGSPEHLKWEEEVEVLRRRMDVLCAKNRGGSIGSDQQDYLAEFDVVNDVKDHAR